MKCYDFDWQINEFMVYCRSTQLRERTMYSYEQTLRLFERWLTIENTAIKYPHGFSIENIKKISKTLGGYCILDCTGI